jgi:hypothetical protein
MQAGDVLTVWTSLKSNLRNSPYLERLVSGHSNVEHVTARGGAFLRRPGPVIMAWPKMEDIAELARGARHIRALCLITWNKDWIRPWVTAVRPTILGDGSPWETLTPELDPLVVAALKDLTRSINHSNTISAGYEKDDVVGVLLALHDARVRLDPDAMEAWVIAHGWTGSNPRALADYVRRIQAGKRPRVTRDARRAGYVDRLREQVADPEN